MPRLIDMEVEPFLISSTLIVAIAQRLVRRVSRVSKSKSGAEERCGTDLVWSIA